MSQIIKFIFLCLVLSIFPLHVSCNAVDSRPRIINGVLASDLAFVVSIHVTFNDEEIRLCVGSIISDFYVLTSATCLYDLPRAEWRGHVRAGSFYLHSGGEVHNFVKMIEHPEFNFTTREHDMLLIMVENPFVFTESLKEGHIDFSLIRGGARVAIAGWGATDKTATSEPSEELMVISDETLNTLECQTQLSGRDDITVALHFDDSLCTLGMPDGTMCNDWGAPLIHENKIIGIWAWGPTDCDGEYPNVFTRVSPHINWIAKYRGAVHA